MKILLFVIFALLVSLLVIFIVSFYKKPDGVILVNKSDPFKDIYTLELHVSFGELESRRRVIFEVKEV